MADLDLDRIAQHRTELNGVGAELTTLGAELVARQTELSNLRVAGAAAGVLEDSERRVADLERHRADLHSRRTELTELIGTAAAGLLDAIEPEAAVEALDGKVPGGAAAGTDRDPLRGGQHRPAHPDLPRPGAPRRPRAGVHGRRTGRRRVVLERAVAGARRRGASRGRVEHAGRPLPSRPGALPARRAAPGEPRPRTGRAAGVPRDRHARRLVDASGRGHRPARALGGDRVPGHLRGLPHLVGPGARSPGRRSLARRPRDPCATGRR